MSDRLSDGVLSLFLFSKFEEIYAPEVNEFVFITDDTYTRQQVLRMEHLMIKVSVKLEKRDF